VLAAVGLALAIAYCPGIAGAGTTPRWIVAAFAPWLIMHRAPVLSCRAVPLAVFIGWALLSVLWAPQTEDAIGSAIELVIACGAFLFGAAIEKPRALFVGFGIGVPIATMFHWWGPDYDLGAEAAAAAAIALLAYPWGILTRCLAAANGLVLLLSHSRGACLAACLVAAWLLVKRRAFRSLALLLIVAIAILGWKVYDGGSFGSFGQRIAMWHDGIEALNWTGWGLGSVWTQYPLIASHMDVLAYGAARPEHLHDDFLEIAFEQGIIGAILAGFALWTLVYRQVWNPQTLILAAVLACSTVDFSLHMPATLFMAAFACGGLCRGVDLRSTIERRRILDLALPVRTAE
jgi:hypothetical protein